MAQDNSEMNIILRDAERRLRRLSLDRLRVADDFLAYLEEKEADSATLELLNLAGFEEQYREAIRQSESGETVRFEDIRRDVSNTSDSNAR
jgi:hypothetical protein